jgi:hypothetical protein
MDRQNAQDKQKAKAQWQKANGESGPILIVVGFVPSLSYPVYPVHPFE